MTDIRGDLTTRQLRGPAIEIVEAHITVIPACFALLLPFCFVAHQCHVAAAAAQEHPRQGGGQNSRKSRARYRRRPPPRREGSRGGDVHGATRQWSPEGQGAGLHIQGEDTRVIYVGIQGRREKNEGKIMRREVYSEKGREGGTRERDKRGRGAECRRQ